MNPRRLILAALAWLAAITAAHIWLNIDLSGWLNDRLPRAQRKFYVAYIPVT